jgi:long-chain acyl-CoA synthetase
VESFADRLAFRRRVETDRRTGTMLPVPVERRRRSSGGGPIYENWTFRQVDEWVVCLTGAILELGLEPGDRVAILSENRPEWGIAYFACVCAGAVAVPLDRGLTPLEIETLLSHSAARYVVAPAGFTPTLLDVIRRVGTVEKILSMEPTDAGPPVVSPQALRARGERSGRSFREVRVAPSDPASIVYTSGTTGNPKGVVITHGNLASQMEALGRVHPLAGDDRFLSVLPMNHLYEFSGGFLGPWVFGASIVYPGSLSPARITESFRDCQVTRIIGVPVLFTLLHDEVAARVTALPSMKKFLFFRSLSFSRAARTLLGVNPGRLLFRPIHRAFGGHLREIICGGAALDPDIAERIVDGGFSVSIGYGLSEASPVVTIGDVAAMPRGSVGKTLPGIEVRLNQPDASGAGELCVRGPNVMAGYYKDPGRTAEVLRDGWLYTGDLARTDEAGHVFIAGRIKDMIVTPGAKKVFPEDLEYFYGRHDLVKEICVVGLDRPDGLGEEPVALVVPREPAPRTAGSRSAVETRIRDQFGELSARIPGYKRVRKMIFRSRGLPKTPSLKVRRFKVKEMLLSSRELRPPPRPTPTPVAGAGSRRTPDR